MSSRLPRHGVVGSALRSAAALVLLGCAAAPAQDRGAAPSPAAPPAASGATQPADTTAPSPALERLQRAARYQRGETPRAAATTLHGRFHVGVRDKDGGLIQADVERWYTRSPERMLTTRTESVSGSTSTVGWDGRTAWFHDQGSGDVVIYSQAPDTYAVDLELLQEQVRVTRLLLDAAVLDALIPRLVQPALGEPVTWTDIDGVEHAAATVEAGLPDELFGPAPGAPPPLPGETPPQLRLRFVIDEQTGALWSLRVAAPHRPDVAPLTLHFDLHGLTRGGLRVPGHVRVFRGDATREELRLGVELVEVDGQERLLFDVDEPLDSHLFETPAAR